MTSTKATELERTTRLLQVELTLARERLALHEELDSRTELALRERLPLEDTLASLLPVFADALPGARTVAVRTFDESLTLRDFVHGDGTVAIDDATWERDGATYAEHTTAVAQRIDVAGQAFGFAVAVVDGRLDPGVVNRARILLRTFCENVDNTLAFIAEARRKSQAIERMSVALRNPVLEIGLDQAIGVLADCVGFDDLVLVFRHEDDRSGASLRSLWIHHGTVVDDSAKLVDVESRSALRHRAARLMEGDDRDLRERLGTTKYREEVLITGVHSARVIGRLIVTSRRGEFNTHDRDLCDRFADSLRQRIVDYNKEWKRLSSAFSVDTCERLLREDGYREKYLTPRERECAVMFCDIAGFTRVCERVLIAPEAIGRLVDLWSAGAVEILWETGGVFDKMVGDCVIGIWGPPFFERSPETLCAAALEASQRIQVWTQSLVNHPQLPELRGTTPLDVATGLHLCPLYVGTFGPDEDFTGFSAGMNNTARLQGQARGGEILCMEPFAARSPGARFGPPREANVKNVAQPLRFAALST